jgi:hypothetical protein
MLKSSKRPPQRLPELSATDSNSIVLSSILLGFKEAKS